jgi:serine/threonine protein kinase
LQAGQIDQQTYDRLMSDAADHSSDSVVSASLIVDRTSRSQEAPDVIIASSGPNVANGALMKPVALVAPGIEISGFKIEKSLGRGGMGEVWRARDLVGERTVVIKLLHPEFATHPEELASVKETFQRVHRLQHQNICPVYLLGQDPRFGYYVVMKYIDGLTLSIYRRKHVQNLGTFGLKEVAKVLGPVAGALDYAHSQRIVHCDVKPQNIMIGRDDGVVELVDFGLAAEIRSSASRMSSTSVEYGGTYPYMSPEQWRGEVLDGRTDQYSLAVVAYELLAGHRPFRASDPEVLRMCALKEVPPPVDAMSGEKPSATAAGTRLDPSVNVALLRGMSKSKSDRFASCTEFVNALCSSIQDVPPTVAGRNRAKGEIAASKIARANEKAMLWVALFGGTVSIALFGVAIWLMMILFQGTSSQFAGGSQKSEAIHSIVKPPPAEPVLRYRWQPERAYLYSVNLDVDQDQDRVVTLSGDLAYSASLPTNGLTSPDQTTRGTGTAFIVHPDGYLLTCHHVTEGAVSIEVALGNQAYPATLIAEDAENDLALIQIDAKKLPVLPLADSSGVELGEEVRAIGFPLSSILGENIKATRGTIAGINEEEGHTIFQIDAAINPGNSGGPLVNEQGEVVGVIFAKLVDNVAANVGFATPVNLAKTLLEAHSVSHAQGRSQSKLSGPALVKQVAAATALVTVVSQSGHHGPKGHVVLRCDGTLKPKSWRRSGQPGDSLDQSPFGRPISFSTASVSTEIDKVETDPFGRIHSISGQGQLPSFLGQAARLIVEYLPSGRQRTWTISHPITLTVQQNTDRHDGPFWGPRFGPRRFGPMPFGPRFGPPGFGGEDSEPVTKTYPGTVRVDYELVRQVDQLQTIGKKYELKTDEQVGANPRIQLNMEGSFVIDVAAGLPKELEMTGRLLENDADTSTTTTPLKLTYKFLEERRLPAGQGQHSPAPPPIATPGQPVDADTKIEVGMKLVCDWSGKWQRVVVLSLNDDGGVRIHWEGWSDQWDEDVPRSRLRLLPK